MPHIHQSFLGQSILRLLACTLSKVGKKVYFALIFLQIPIAAIIFASRITSKTKKQMRQQIKPLWLLIIAAVISCLTLSLNSCGNDEPDMLVGYYLGIQSQVRLTLSEEDESQGTSASPTADMLSTTIVRMRVALRNAYPTANTHGNDSRVIAALDDIFRDYKTMYGASERNTVCVVKLYRTSMEDDIVKHSRTIQTYHFGALPPENDEATL